MRHLIAVDLTRHAARTGLTAIGIAIGVAAILALLGFSAGIERSAAGLIRLGGAELGMFQAGVGELTASRRSSATPLLAGSVCGSVGRCVPPPAAFTSWASTTPGPPSTTRAPRSS
jgi:ABC-type antimicrobial peptide transport system permease subunit